MNAFTTNNNLNFDKFESQHLYLVYSLFKGINISSVTFKEMIRYRFNS